MTSVRPWSEATRAAAEAQKEAGVKTEAAERKAYEVGWCRLKNPV